MGDVKSLAELLAERPRRSDWGPWELSEEDHVLHLPDDRSQYWIDLQTCLTPAAVLDWIVQLAGKTWVDDRILAGLIRALDDILHPQATLCSHGLASSLTPFEIRRRVGEVAKWLPHEDKPAAGEIPSVPARLDGRHLVVDRCPWCRKQHFHGAGDPENPLYGHRVGHCGDGESRGYYLVPPRTGDD